MNSHDPLSVNVPPRRKRSLPVLAHIHRPSHRVAVGHGFEYVTDAGSFIVMRAPAAQLRALHRPPNVSAEKFPSMAPDHLVALLLEKQRMNRVIPRVGDLDVPLSADRHSATLRRSLR